MDTVNLIIKLIMDNILVILYFLWIAFLAGVFWAFWKYQDKFTSVFPKPKTKKHDYFIWMLVNGVLCQLPLMFMFLNSVNPSTIFASGLSYIFTLYISSLYMLLTMADKSNKLIVAREKLHVGSVIAIATTLGLLSIYPGVSQKHVKFAVVDHPYWSYPVIVTLSLFFAFQICKPAIDEKHDAYAKEQESTSELRDASKTDDEMSDFIKSMNEEATP